MVGIFERSQDSDMTWIVSCPNTNHVSHAKRYDSWLLTWNELDLIRDHYSESLIGCSVCNYKFSLIEGVKEAFISDNPFVFHRLQYNAEQSGQENVIAGIIKTVKFSHPFEKPPAVYLTPNKPMVVVPAKISESDFIILSAPLQNENECDVWWGAYGDFNDETIPMWRKMLSSSTAHKSRKDFRSEVVDLESAVELFIDDYLGDKLHSRGFGIRIIEWIFRRNINEKLSIWLEELTGKNLTVMNSQISGNWQKNLKELRNSIVHRGHIVTPDEALEARRAAIDLILKVNPRAINEFRIRLSWRGI